MSLTWYEPVTTCWGDMEVELYDTAVTPRSPHGHPSPCHTLYHMTVTLYHPCVPCYMRPHDADYAVIRDASRPPGLFSLRVTQLGSDSLISKSTRLFLVFSSSDHFTRLLPYSINHLHPTLTRLKALKPVSTFLYLPDHSQSTPIGCDTFRSFRICLLLSI